MEKDELEKLVYQEYLKCDNDMKKVHISANTLGITAKQFLQILKEFIQKNKTVTSLITIYEKLLLLEDESSIISYLDSTQITIAVLRNNITRYLMEYRPDLLIQGDYVETSLNRKVYVFEKYLSKRQKTKTDFVDIEMVNIAYDFLTKYLNSTYSLERFCYQERVNKTYFKSLLCCAKKHLHSLCNECTQKNSDEEVKKRLTIENDVRTIFSMIKDNTSFTIIDFLENTIYSFNEIINCADQILTKEEQRIFRRIVSPFKDIKPLNDTSISNILRTDFSYNIDNEIVCLSDDIKNDSIRYLRNNDIPISMDTFKIICIKIYKGEIDTKEI